MYYEERPYDPSASYYPSTTSKQYSSKSLLGQARVQFVRKVYAILTLQLLITSIVVWAACTYPAFRRFQAKHTTLLWVNLIAVIGTMIALNIQKISRTAPLNYGLLGLFTLGESYSVAFMSTFYEPQSVLFAASLTLAITLGLTLHALSCKEDYTVSGGMLFGAISMLFYVCFLNWFLRIGFINFLLSLGYGAVYLGLLVFDTQSIMGGRKKEISLDDYIMGAMTLYMDIISVFLKILELLGEKKKKRDRD